MKMIEVLFWMTVTGVFWGGIALAAAKGWAGAVVVMVGLLFVLHLFPGFVVVNTWVVSALQVRKDYFRKDYYFDSLESEAAASS